MTFFAFAGLITKAVAGIVPSDTPHVKVAQVLQVQRPAKFKGSKNKKKMDPKTPSSHTRHFYLSLY